MKKLLNGKTFYIGLVLLSCIVGVITYSAMTKRLANQIDPAKIEIPEFSGIIQTPDIPDSNASVPIEYEQKETSTAPEKSDSTVMNTVKSSYFSMPVNGTIIKEYSPDALVFSNTLKDYRAHMGIDISAPVGTPVKAVASGKIIDITDDDLMGVTIKIDHGKDLVSVYSGLSYELPADILIGAEVEALTVIGGIGETAVFESSDPSHLHFELLKAGENIDPFSKIK